MRIREWQDFSHKKNNIFTNELDQEKKKKKKKKKEKKKTEKTKAEEKKRVTFTRKCAQQ